MAIQLGAISYPLYAIHAPTMHWVDGIFAPAPLPRIAVTVMLSLALAWSIGSRIDPLLRRKLAALPPFKSASPAGARRMPRVIGTPSRLPSST